MEWRVSLLAAVLIPLLGSLTLPLVGMGSRRLRNLWAVLLGAGTLFFAFSLLPEAMSGETLLFEFPLGFGMDIAWMVDGLSVFMAISSSLVSLFIILYSLGYIQDHPHQQEYFMMVLLFLGAMIGLVFSAHLMCMYVFWEITGICSWRLIGFFRDRETIVKADKAFLTTFGGAVFMLLGFALIYDQTHTFNMVAMRGTSISIVAATLITVGIFAKSATLPFHTWLPDAGVAPTTVTALLHAAVLVKIGVYAFARIFNYAFVLPPEWPFYILVLSLLSAGVSACAALMENNIKRILAYSTVSQIGYIFMGLATFNAIGVAGALLFILMHGLAKAGLFLCAGVIEHSTGTKDIRRMGGLHRVMPATGLAFLACAFSVIGIPPFGGFYSKGLVIQGLIQSDHAFVAILAILIAILTAAYLMRLFTLIFLGDLRDRTLHSHPEGTPSMVWVVVSLAVLSLFSGLLVRYPEALVHQAVNTIMANPAMHQMIGALK